jgi:IPT/TIG domain
MAGRQALLLRRPGLVITALLLFTFSAFLVAPAAQAVHTSNTGWQWTPWTAPATGTYFIWDFAASSPTDIWAVGQIYEPSDSLIIHWDGGEWTRVSSPTSQPLLSISAASADNIWAVGNEGTIIHYGGRDTGWESVASPIAGSIYEVSVLPSGEGWALGRKPYLEGGGPEYLHCADGKTWHNETLPTTNGLYCLCVLAPDDIWTSWGGGTSDVHLLHWNGSDWSDVSQFSGASHAQKIYAKGPSDVWAIEAGTDVWHYNGTSWSYAAATNMANRDFVPMQDGGFMIVGIAGGTSGLWYFDGSSGGALESPTTGYLFAIVEAGPRNLWMGGDGPVFNGVPGAPVLDTVTPDSGSIGAELTLGGHCFGGFRGNSVVRFNGLEAPISDYMQWSDTQIKVKVPAGTESGGVSVETETGHSGVMHFSVTPTIKSITPSSANAGTTVPVADISGESFTGTPIVKLKRSGQKDINSTGVTLVSSLKIECRLSLPVSASTGAWDLYVENPDGQNATLVGAFTVNSAASTWFLPEGSTAWGFDCYITITNPNAEDVAATVTYMTSDGPVSGGRITLPAMSQTTVNPVEKLGSKDFSTRVVCTEGKGIAVDRTMSWTGPGAASPEGHSSVGVTSPATTWYLPEGSSAWGFECWLLIQNPNAGSANCTVTYMIEGEGPRTVNHTVPANSRKTFNMADDIGAKNASIKVVSSVPVIPERAMYRNNKREGHDSIGTTAAASDYYLAEGTTAWGFTTWLLIQNPVSDASTVTITYMTPSGKKAQSPFNLPGNSRKTIKVNDVAGMGNTDFSTQVHGSQPIIAERSMYWDNGTGEACHDSIGMDAAHTTFYLPDGQSSGGYETWTLVQNPNASDVQVEISYLTSTGTGNVVETETIPANSRRTFGMLEHSGINGRASIMVTSKTGGKKIMVERAIYWSSRGAGTDTIGGYSD